LLAYVNDKLLAFEEDSYRALDPQNGTEIWSGRFLSLEQVYTTESLAFDNDHLYLAATNKVIKIDLKHGCVVGRYANPYTTDAFFNQAVISPDGKTLYAGTLKRHFGFKKP
jgi:outer membrane protein assembly factor BamB